MEAQRSRRPRGGWQPSTTTASPALRTLSILATCLVATVAVVALTTWTVAEATPRSTSGGRAGPRVDRAEVAVGSGGGVTGSAETTPVPLESLQEFGIGNRTEWNLHQFEAWFSQNGGGWSRHVRAEFHDGGVTTDRAELVVVALDDLAPESEIVRVPESLLLHASLLTARSKSRFTEHQQLALVLLDEVALGEESKWAPYIRLLPAQLASPLYFKQADLDALAGTYSGVMATHMVQQYTRFETAALQWAATHRRGATTNRVFTPPLLRWAVSMVHSRAFTIDKPNEPNHPLNGRPFLAPAADLLNHKSSARVGWSLGSRNRAAASVGGAFQIFTLDGAGAQQQVYNHYQDFGGAHLLSHYGFSVQDNENDFLPISLGLPTNEIGTPLAAYKVALLKQLGLRQVQKLRPSGVSVSMLNVVRVLALDEPQKDWPAAVGDASRHLLPVSREVEARARRLLSDALTALLSGIPDSSTVDERVSELARPVIRSVITEERRLLSRALRWLIDDGPVGAFDSSHSEL